MLSDTRLHAKCTSTCRVSDQIDYWTLCKNSYASSGGGGGDDAIAQNEMVSQGNCQVVKDFPPLSTRMLIVEISAAKKRNCNSSRWRMRFAG